MFGDTCATHQSTSQAVSAAVDASAPVWEKTKETSKETWAKTKETLGPTAEIASQKVQQGWWFLAGKMQAAAAAASKEVSSAIGIRDDAVDPKPENKAFVL